MGQFQLISLAVVGGEMTFLPTLQKLLGTSVNENLKHNDVEQCTVLLFQRLYNESSLISFPDSDFKSPSFSLSFAE